MATSWIKRRHSLSTSADVCLSNQLSTFNFLGFIVGLISCCCSRRASVERSLCLKWLTMSFPTSHSRNTVLKFCGRRTAGDVSQSTILRPELFPGGSVFAAWKRTLHCYNFVVLDGGRGRLTSRSFSATCSPVRLPRKTTSPSKRIKSSSPQQSLHPWLQKLVEASDARATGRRSLS